MKSEPLVFVGTCDLAGLVRGKGFPLEELAVRMRRGVGLTHSNIMMSAFGPIYDTPFGTEGESRAVLRVPRSHGLDLSRALGEVQRVRSARKLDAVRIQVEPPTL